MSNDWRPEGGHLARRQHHLFLGRPSAALPGSLPQPHPLADAARVDPSPTASITPAPS
jgi:hypothetical protein